MSLHQFLYLELSVKVSPQKGLRSLHFFKLVYWGGGRVQLSPLDTAATNRPIVSAPSDYDDGETCPSAVLSTTNPTCCPDANPGRRGGKPATIRLSYDMAVALSKLSTGVS
jgi:hypothetical protein